MDKQSILITLIGICLGIVPCALPAEENGTQSWLCVPIEEIECGHTGACHTDARESLNLPQFIKIDLATKRASGTEAGQEEVATIQHMERLDGRLILQGTQNGRGWSVVIVEATGKMTLSAAGEDVAWLAFGACTPLADLLETEKTS